MVCTEPMTRNNAFLTALNRNFWRWLSSFVCIVVALAAIRSAVADWSAVPTTSMTPTILAGDRIYVNKVAYDLKLPFTARRLFTWAEPRRGDVVIFSSPADGKLLVKRVVAVPGDVIEMRTNQLYVNHPSSEATHSTAVPAGKYFVMGDNRAHSFDSRYFGLVDRGGIVGKAVGVVISLDPAHYSLPRWGRFAAGLN